MKTNPLTTATALAGFLAGATLLGCKPRTATDPVTASKPRSDRRELIQRLDQAGFYRYCESPEQASAVRDAAIHGGPIFADAVRRTCPMNTEKLAMGGVREFMETCKDRFIARGVILDVIEQVFFVSVGYFGRINGEDFLIYEEEEGAYTPALWDKAVLGTFQMGNDLLERAGTYDRLYQLRADHDAAAVFLTEEQFKILQSASVPDDEKPRVPTVRETK